MLLTRKTILAAAALTALLAAGAQGAQAVENRGHLPEIGI